MNLGIDLLWNRAPTFLEGIGCPALLYPLVFCTLGGLAIGLFQKRVGPYPDDMSTVLAEVKKSGRYEYKHIKAMFLGALMPLMFGGSIGPEARTHGRHRGTMHLGWRPAQVRGERDARTRECRNRRHHLGNLRSPALWPGCSPLWLCRRIRRQGRDGRRSARRGAKTLENRRLPAFDCGGVGCLHAP